MFCVLTLSSELLKHFCVHWHTTCGEVRTATGRARTPVLHCTSHVRLQAAAAWTSGVMLYQMLVGYHPFSQDIEVLATAEALIEVRWGSGTHTSQAFVQLIFLPNCSQCSALACQARAIWQALYG